MAREPSPGDTVWFVCEQNDPEQIIHCIAPTRKPYVRSTATTPEVFTTQGVVWSHDPKRSTEVC
jgi:hypothetical protein